MSGSQLAEAAEPVFARHETFPLRFGWLHKAYTAATNSSTAFSEPTATVDLGVGKNMVNAIRYWAQAYKILETADNPDRPRMPYLQPTAFGTQLLGDDGWDPWLENPGSLWLLHWKLLAPPSMAPVWWAAFHLFPPEQFDEQQLVDYVGELTGAAGWSHVIESSIKKDVDCMLRTFALRRLNRQTMDDLLDCPARELGLIELAAGDTKAWRFVTGVKPALSPTIVAYTCLDYLHRKSPGERNISIARLTSDPGSPGRAFRLTESALFAALSTAAAADPDHLQVAEPGGMRQLVVTGDVHTAADSTLAGFYNKAAA